MSLGEERVGERVLRERIEEDVKFCVLVHAFRCAIRISRKYGDDHGSYAPKNYDLHQLTLVVKSTSIEGMLKRINNPSHSAHDNIWFANFPTWCKNCLYICKSKDNPYQIRMSTWSTGQNLDYAAQDILAKDKYLQQNDAYPPSDRTRMEENYLLTTDQIVLVYERAVRDAIARTLPDLPIVLTNLVASF
jgi:hypothetical protein